MEMLYSAITNGFYCVDIHGAAIPADAVPISDERYLAAAGKVIFTDTDGLPSPVPAPAADPVAPLLQAVQLALDTKAREWGYDDIKTAVGYRGDPNTTFAAEAESLFQWRSAIWTQAYALLAAVNSGTRAFPTITEALALLPAIERP